MRDLVAICLLILHPFFAEPFCFITSVPKGATKVPLGSGPEQLISPFPLIDNSEFNSDFYDCNVINHGQNKKILAVHCCYTLNNLEDEVRWNEETFRDVLKKIYFT